jgi:hypothetical protein
MLKNEQMKSGRFQKLQNGRRLISKFKNAWEQNLCVYICTYTKAIKVSDKEKDCIKIGKSGSVYVQRGKNWDCIDGCAIKIA